jgi:imidazolonepropionase-like amidohydrolase
VRIWDGRSDAPYVGEVLVVGNKIQSVSHAGIAPAPELHPIAIGDGRHYTDPPRRLGGGLTLEERTGMTTIADGVPEVLAAARDQMGHGAAMLNVMASGGAASEFDPIEVVEYTPEELEILRQVTSGNAELLAMSGRRNPYPGKLGVIEEGAYADILLINGEPLQDITLLEHPDVALALIMKDGGIYKNQLSSAGAAH